jgi:lariat debranching enzyme
MYANYSTKKLVLTLDQGHGNLNCIYASVTKACETKGWDGVDLVIIGGDFQVHFPSYLFWLLVEAKAYMQAVRNSYDLNCMSVPKRFRAIGDFHEYYSGARIAPYLTIFIGGNHEASNHLWELYYGGWVAPNIYYMGAANVVRLGGLRIAGLSGIWKGYEYSKPHFERVPLSQNNIKSIYHVREIDVRKLLCIDTHVDVGLSHDWPRGIEYHGNYNELFQKKEHFVPDSQAGTLGSVAAEKVLYALRPRYWFSGHMHVKFTAKVFHKESSALSDLSTEDKEKLQAEWNAKFSDPDRIHIQDEDLGESKVGQYEESAQSPPASVIKNAITNLQTEFLALDKSGPNRDFLQLVEITSASGTPVKRPVKLEYDEEWLAITRVMASEFRTNDPAKTFPRDKGTAHYQRRVQEELKWIAANINPDQMLIPENFQITAPVYDSTVGLFPKEQNRIYENPQTQIFCDMLQINNVFKPTKEELVSWGTNPLVIAPDALDDDVPNGHEHRGYGRGPRRGGRGRGDSGRSHGNSNRGRGRGGFSQY